MPTYFSSGTRPIPVLCAALSPTSPQQPPSVPRAHAWNQAEESLGPVTWISLAILLGMQDPKEDIYQ